MEQREKYLVDEDHKRIVRQCAEFLDPTDPRARSYRAEINLMLARGEKRVRVWFDVLERQS
jgi:DNA replication licensing factor MCM3